MTITAVLVDSREPNWVKELTFGGIPTSVTALEAGDIWAVTDDGCILMIERKESNDLLNTMKAERLFPQMAKLVQRRLDQEAMSQKISYYPYLMITGRFERSADDNVITERDETGWNWHAVQGALLDIQEMGVFVVMGGEDREIEKSILRLGNRKRESSQLILPPRPPQIAGYDINILTSLPGIGMETARKLLEYAGKPAWAICSLTDLSLVDSPVGKALRERVRRTLGLRGAEEIQLWINSQGDEILGIGEKNVYSSKPTTKQITNDH